MYLLYVLHSRYKCDDKFGKTSSKFVDARNVRHSAPKISTILVLEFDDLFVLEYWSWKKLSTVGYLIQEQCHSISGAL